MFEIESDEFEDECCGCCGHELSGPGEVWCDPCKLHVGHFGPLEDRTYYARTGRNCPYQNQAKNFGPVRG